jgi:hypothetical protein
VLDAYETGTIDDSFRPLVDWEELVAFLRVEQWIGNEDGYGHGPNNYRIYFEPDSPLVITPWDLDGSFPTPGEYGEKSREAVATDSRVTIPTQSWEDSGTSLARICLVDPECRAIWDGWELPPGMVPELSSPGWVDGAVPRDQTLHALALELDALIEEAVLGDPRNECDEEFRQLEREALLDYLLTGEADTESSGEGGECSHARGDGSGTGALAIGLGLWGLLLRRRPVRVRPFAAGEGQA